MEVDDNLFDGLNGCDRSTGVKFGKNGVGVIGATGVGSGVLLDIHSKPHYIIKYNRLPDR